MPKVNNDAPMLQYKKHSFFIFLIILILCSSCSTILTKEQPKCDNDIKIRSSQSFGQTFLARYNGLSSITLGIRTSKSIPNCALKLTLYQDVDHTEKIADSDVLLSSNNKSPWVSFTFTPIQKSLNNQYYFEITSPNQCAFKIVTGAFESYIEGSAYLNNEPIHAQGSFFLGYQSFHLILGVLVEFLYYAIVFLLQILALSLPGQNLLKLLLPSERQPWETSLIVSIIIGICFYVVLFLYLKSLNIRIGKPIVLSITLILLIYFLFSKKNSIPKIVFKIPSIEYLSLLLVIGIIFFTRFWATRNLVAPMWGDSVQHATMIQLIIDNHGLFDNWLPYAPYSSLTVQYGFALLGAILSWITNLQSLQSTIYIGQILNILAILSLYPIAVHFSHGNKWIGILTILVAGLVSPMPAYYVNWGRYAQLAGQAILPTAILLMIRSIEINSSLTNKAKSYLLAAFVIAGMALSYYRMPYYLICFMGSYLIYQFLRERNLRSSAHALFTFITISLMSIALIYPWLINLKGGVLASALEQGYDSTLSSILSWYNIWKDTDFFLPRYWLGITLFVTLLSIKIQNKSAQLYFIWALALFLLPAATLLRIPGVNFINPFAVIIAFYMPVSLIIGSILNIIPLALQEKTKCKSLLFVIIFSMGILYGFKTRSIANPINYALVTKPDMRAFRWIKDNTPEQSLFLVEGFTIYNGRSIVGADAGWYIPLLANRKNTMPPQYALLNEKPIHPDQNSKLVDLVVSLEKNTIYSETNIGQLCKNKIDYVFIGQRQGKIGDNVKVLFLPEDLFANKQWFDLIYHQDGVYIFKFYKDRCN